MRFELTHCVQCKKKFRGPEAICGECIDKIGNRPPNREGFDQEFMAMVALDLHTVSDSDEVQGLLRVKDRLSELGIEGGLDLVPDDYQPAVVRKALADSQKAHDEFLAKLQEQRSHLDRIARWAQRSLLILGGFALGIGTDALLRVLVGR